MSDPVDLYDVIESDPELKAWIDAQGLELSNPPINLQVRTLRAMRGLTLLTDVERGNHEAYLHDTTTSLVGEALIEEDRLAVWDGKAGDALHTSISVAFFGIPAALPKDHLLHHPLGQMPHIHFNSDVFFDWRGGEFTKGGSRWTLLIPLPKDELKLLWDAVDSHHATEVWIVAFVGNLFERKRDFVPPIHEPTDYFALPSEVVANKVLPTTPPFRVADMPCLNVRVSVQQGTLASLELEKREQEERDADRGWEPAPVSVERQQLVATEGVRDALRLIAVVLFLIGVMLLASLL